MTDEFIGPLPPFPLVPTRLLRDLRENLRRATLNGIDHEKVYTALSDHWNHPEVKACMDTSGTPQDQAKKSIDFSAEMAKPRWRNMKPVNSFPDSASPIEFVDGPLFCLETEARKNPYALETLKEVLALWQSEKEPPPPNIKRLTVRILNNEFRPTGRTRNKRNRGTHLRNLFIYHMVSELRNCHKKFSTTTLTNSTSAYNAFEWVANSINFDAETVENIYKKEQRLRISLQKKK